MEITLQITSFHRLTPTQTETITFDHRGGTIGRSDKNDWVLQDPERLVSGTHAKIECRDNKFYLIDTSTNGVFLNQSSAPLGKTKSACLRNGDKIQMGEFEVDVLLDALESANDSLPPQAPANPSIESPQPDPSSVSKHLKSDLVHDRGHFGVPSVIPDDWDDKEAQAAEPTNITAPALTPTSVPGIPDDILQIDSPRAASGDAMMNALFRGIGLNPNTVTGGVNEATMQQIGELVRDSLDGLIDALRTRANIKNEFRVNQTTIKPVDNNPLKFSANAQDALQTFFNQNNSAYLTSKQAIKDAFNDLHTHQLGMMAGLQNATLAALNKYNPKNVTDRLEHGSWTTNMVPGSKKAKYWDNYISLYRDLMLEAQEGVHKMFGDEFAKAYENHVRQLSH